MRKVVCTVLTGTGLPFWVYEPIGVRRFRDRLERILTRRIALEQLDNDRCPHRIGLDNFLAVLEVTSM
ncbi:hypothetical protein SAZ10_15870 [Mesorhizobium sp. BAC0120]|uniref:hypothetical protein n=1 Tax=Mesorhizobium sp. BAC0120 TaxID=3090670 RepID=UPI00298C4AD9|nr:hypothetical protein [Mesorhizobium sp. BAC0120]MDW6023236.1 hypothetical protein [Mesorhizobium sp. BAC0120]